MSESLNEKLIFIKEINRVAGDTVAEGVGSLFSISYIQSTLYRKKAQR